MPAIKGKTPAPRASRRVYRSLLQMQTELFDAEDGLMESASHCIRHHRVRLLDSETAGFLARRKLFEC